MNDRQIEAITYIEEAGEIYSQYSGNTVKLGHGIELDKILLDIAKLLQRIDIGSTIKRK